MSKDLNTLFIYESPDKGKTIYIRKPMDYENREILTSAENMCEFCGKSMSLHKPLGRYGCMTTCSTVDITDKEMEDKERQEKIWEHMKRLDKETLEWGKEEFQRWEETHKEFKDRETGA